MASKKVQDPLAGMKVDLAKPPDFGGTEMIPIAVEEPKDLRPTKVSADYKSYRVLKEKTIIWGSRGQMIRLGAGDIVSDSSHGPNAIITMKDAGVELEEVGK